MNLRIAIKEKISLIADVEQGFASGNENHTAIMVKLEGKFN